MSFPTSPDPVKAILATSLFRASAAPAVEPKPVTILTTPGGIPASMSSCPRRRVVSGVSSAGFTTQLQPAASAGASFVAASESGEFQGVIMPATPTGSLSV